MKRRLGVFVIALVVISGAAMVSAGALFAPSPELVLAQPTVSCTSGAVVNMSWTDTVSGAYYRPLWRHPTDANWSFGAWTAGNARATSFAAPTGALEVVIEGWTDHYRDSNVRTVTVSCGTQTDTTAPTVPSSLNGSAASCSQVNLSWGASTDTGGSGLKGYNVYRNNVLLKFVATPATTTSDTGLAGSTSYSYQVSAIDNSTNQSARTAAKSVATLACTANQAPIANAGVDQSAQTSVSLTFNGSASRDPDGTISSYAWTFGDGTIGNGVSLSHAYAAAGTYTVTLTVTDNAGAKGSDSAIATITAPTGPTTWGKQMGAAGSDSATSVATDAAGNTYVAATFSNTITIGTTSLASAGAQDVALAKYSPSGAVLWARRMGGALSDQPGGLAVDANGNVDLVGTFSGSASFGGATLAVTGGSQVDMFVAQYNGATGAHQWSKGFGGVYTDQAKGVAVDSTGNIYFTGFFEGTVNFGGGPLSVPYTSDLDVFIAKFTKAGAYTWAKHFTNTGNDQGYGIGVDPQGNVAVGGTFSNAINFGGGDLVSGNAMTDVFVADFTTNGVYRWQRRLGAPDSSEGARGIAVDGAGNVVVVGAGIKAFDLGGGSVAAFGSSDGFVAKYAAANGAYQWGARLGGTGNDYANSVAVDSAGNILVAGAFEGTASFSGASAASRGQSDGFVVKYSNAGARSWVRTYGGNSADWFNSVAATPGTSANPVLGGYFYGAATFEGTSMTSAGAADGVIVRTTP
jgi:chitodextrinase